MCLHYSVWLFPLSTVTQLTQSQDSDQAPAVTVFIAAAAAALFEGVAERRENYEQERDLRKN